MEEVTDAAFREMFARYSSQEPRFKNQEPNGNSFVMFTEFVNVDGLLHPVGYEKLKMDLKFTEIQRPMVAQIWGTDPEKFFRAAELIVSLKFDGIDINMGCPQDKEIGIGACAALIRNPELASQIIEATLKGAGDLPVSVKTRTGYLRPETETWIGHLLKHNLAAISLHARTKQEKSKVPAQWSEVKKAVDVRNDLSSQTLIIGNGDVKTREEGLKRIAETGCDGVMIGKGAFGNPWLFRTDGYVPDVKEKLRVMLEHAELFVSTFAVEAKASLRLSVGEKQLGNFKSFFIMRKHFKAYASGFDGASELRAKLMEAKDLQETKKIVAEFLDHR